MEFFNSKVSSIIYYLPRLLDGNFMGYCILFVLNSFLYLQSFTLTQLTNIAHEFMDRRIVQGVPPSWHTGCPADR
jgi:hypothetical protein